MIFEDNFFAIILFLLMTILLIIAIKMLIIDHKKNILQKGIRGKENTNRNIIESMEEKLTYHGLIFVAFFGIILFVIGAFSEINIVLRIAFVITSIFLVSFSTFTLIYVYKINKKLGKNEWND